MGRSLAQDKIVAIKTAMMQLDKNLVAESGIIKKQIQHEKETKSTGNVAIQEKSIGENKGKIT